jgi:hypothetical protein
VSSRIEVCSAPINLPFSSSMRTRPLMSSLLNERPDMVVSSADISRSLDFLTAIVADLCEVWWECATLKYFLLIFVPLAWLLARIYCGGSNDVM